MKTLFDIGDKIELNMTGTVRSFSVNKDGDCYVIDLNVGKDNITSAYLNSDILLVSNAKKINN